MIYGRLKLIKHVDGHGYNDTLCGTFNSRTDEYTTLPQQAAKDYKDYLRFYNNMLDLRDFADEDFPEIILCPKCKAHKDFPLLVLGGYK